MTSPQRDTNLAWGTFCEDASEEARLELKGEAGLEFGELRGRNIF